MPKPSAAESYDWWAEAYDECNSENDYELWLGQILLPHLERHGLKCGWALDIGCGTGLAFLPLLERGWQVIGCDVSAGMLREAERKFRDAVQLLEFDARDLPRIELSCNMPSQQGFDLVLMLNDVINYLTEDGDLDRVFSGIRKNLSSGGLAVLDSNTVALFQRDYALGPSESLGSRGWRWRGLTKDHGPEEVYEGELEDPSGLTRPHRQRHWSSNQIQKALASSGLKCVAILGQREEAGEIRVSTSPSEAYDQKTLYVISHQ
jgi:SAM-dependent methyltransferase